jgi:hypothetical protein
MADSREDHCSIRQEERHAIRPPSHLTRQTLTSVSSSDWIRIGSNVSGSFEPWPAPRGWKTPWPPKLQLLARHQAGPGERDRLPPGAGAAPGAPGPRAGARRGRRAGGCRFTWTRGGVRCGCADIG